MVEEEGEGVHISREVCFRIMWVSGEGCLAFGERRDLPPEIPVGVKERKECTRAKKRKAKGIKGAKRAKKRKKRTGRKHTRAKGMKQKQRNDEDCKAKQKRTKGRSKTSGDLVAPRKGRQAQGEPQEVVVEEPVSPPRRPKQPRGYGFSPKTRRASAGPRKPRAERLEVPPAE